MTKIYVNFVVGFNAAPIPWKNNVFDSGDVGVGVLSADMLDDADTLTGVGLEVITAFTSASGSGDTATSDNVWPKEVFQTYWKAGAGGAALRLSGLNIGDEYLLELAGHTFESDRPTDFTVDGVTSQYVSAGAPTPNAPIELSGTLTGTTLDITAELVNIAAQFNGFTLTLAPPSATIAITDIDGDNDVFDGQVTTLTGTVLGADGGTLSFDGVAQTVASNTATTANITVVQDELAYGAHNAIWTDTLLNESPPFPFTISPAAGLQVITAASPALDGTSLFNGVIPIVTNGDQLELPTTTTQGNPITIRANGTFLIGGSAVITQTFNYRVFHPSLGTWTNYGSVTVN